MQFNIKLNDLNFFLVALPDFPCLLDAFLLEMRIFNFFLRMLRLSKFFNRINKGSNQENLKRS